MFIEIVEFNSRHIPLLYDRVMPEIIQLAPLLAGRQGRLRDLPVPIMVRSFTGLFFSYYVTGQLVGEQHGMLFNQQALDNFIDVYLHGILADDDPDRQRSGSTVEEVK
jgi:hypothetical protein